MIAEDFLLDKFQSIDKRGTFLKSYSKNFKSLQNFDISEVFYSISNIHVLRGLHYQKRPYEHNKIVTVLKGEIIDLLLCVDNALPDYGKSIHIKIDDRSEFSIFVPKGYAHGFYVCSEAPAIIAYMTDGVHNPNYDTGVYWDSISFDCPIVSPIISNRDAALPNFGDHEW